jgi:hypothetical protein
MNASGRRWVGVVVVLATLVSCARSGGSAGSPASDLNGVKASQVANSPASGLMVGTVTGVVRTYGGPLMPNGKMAADGNPSSGVPVTASHNGKTVASMVTGANGGYRFMLAPGSYVLTGCSAATVVVEAGVVVHQDLRCDVP